MAKKISIEAKSAFLNFEKFNKSNTRVEVSQHNMVYGTVRVARLFLFDNLIAKIDGGDLSITTAGWDTVTTKERLNVLDGVSVSTKKGILYLNGKKWDGNMVNVSYWNDSI